MRKIERLISFLLLVLAAATTQAGQQSPVTPEWSKAVHLHDGRVFVSDRNIILDAAFVKPTAIPAQSVDPAWLQSFLGTAQPNEFPVSRFTQRLQGQTPVYVAPTGMLLSAKYVEYLQRLFKSPTLRFRCSGPLDPALIVVNGAAVGALMPMAP